MRRYADGTDRRIERLCYSALWAALALAAVIVVTNLR